MTRVVEGTSYRQWAESQRPVVPPPALELPRARVKKNPCSYCGTETEAKAGVCRSCSDLPGLDEYGNEEAL